MRILQGSKVIDAPSDWRQRVGAAGQSVVVDLGAGDGRYAYESARRDPDALYVAVDPDADTLAAYAYRAARKPARGGIENAVFVVAPLEALPADLEGLAARVRINFPWAGLLHALMEPDAAALERVASLLAKGGVIEIVMSYDPEHDTGAFAGATLPKLDANDIETRLVPAYRAAGFDVVEQQRLTADEALALASTWGRRLLHARPRDVYFLACMPAVDM